IEHQLGGNAFTSAVLDGNQQATLNALAAKPGGLKLGDVAIISQLQSTTRDLLAPQLAASHLAPVVMNIGRHIPGLGPFGPTDTPKRTCRRPRRRRPGPAGCDTSPSSSSPSTGSLSATSGRAWAR